LPGDAGGQITMPLQPTFWAKTWGMLIDKFGTPWTVNYERVLCSQEQKS
jgi:PhnB protein